MDLPFQATETSVIEAGSSQINDFSGKHDYGKFPKKYPVDGREPRECTYDNHPTEVITKVRNNFQRGIGDTPVLRKSAPAVFLSYQMA